MAYKTITTEVDVDIDIDLDDFEDDELLEEIERRNLSVHSTNKEEADRLLDQIYIKRVTNKDYTAELDKYLYEVLGRIV